MKKIKFAKRLMLAMLIFFIAYNTYFGWNKLPQSELEKTFDYIFNIGVIIETVIYFSPLLKIYEKWIESNGKE